MIGFYSESIKKKNQLHQLIYNKKINIFHVKFLIQTSKFVYNLEV